MNLSDPEGVPSKVDRTRRTFIDYIDRTREHYLAQGFNNPYEWAYHEDVPFTPLVKPLAECRVGIITTAAPFQPDKGDQGPYAPYNNDAKFSDVYTLPFDPVPDLRMSHIGYDRANTVPDDLNAFFPLAQARSAVGQGRIAGIPRRFHGVPTLRSQRHTIDIDAPEILRLCREDAVDAAILPAI